MLTKPSSRSGARLSTLKIQPPSASRCAPTARPLSQRGIQSTTPNPITSALATLRKDQCLHQPSKSATPHLLRFASTSAADQDTTTTAPGQPTTSHPPSLTWNEYLSLRKVRRRYNLAASIVTSLGTTSAGITVLSQQNVVSEQLGGLFGLDPFILLGLATASSGAVGWLLGPFVGNAVFGMVHRRVGREIAEVSCEAVGRCLRDIGGGRDRRLTCVLCV